MKEVTVKQNRVCKNCHKVIIAGKHYMTYSIPYKGRFWVCMNCYSLANKKKNRKE